MAAARATRKTKKDVYELYAKALEAVQKGAYKTALTTIGRIQRGFPAEIEVLARARSLEAICNRSIEPAPKPGGPRTNAETLFDQGVYFHNRGDYEQAMELFGKALKKDSGAGHVLYAMAASEALRGNVEESIAHLEQAIAQDATHRYHAANDPDLAGLREEDAFRGLVSE